VAHYVAWFAPAEKTFFDTRLRFHRPEAAEYAALRKYLVPRDPRERRQDPYDLAAFLHKHRITYAVSAHRHPVHNLAAVMALWGDEPDPATGPEWALWHVDGRAVVLGWTRQEAIPESAFDRLRFDPLRAAYAEAERLPTPAVRPPLPARDIWERFVVAPPTAPVEAEEAFILMRYRENVMNRAAFRHRVALEAVHLVARDRLQTPAWTLWTLLPLVGDPRLQSLVPPTMPPEVSAIALLSVRAARRAIISSPDHPDGYYYLAKAYADSAYYVDPGVQELVVTASLGRVRVRLPDKPGPRRPTLDVLDLCLHLAELHGKAGRMDLLRDVTKLSAEYLRADVAALEDEANRLTGEARDRAEKDIDARRKALAQQERDVAEAEKQLARMTDRYILESARHASALDRAAVARSNGLTRQAVEELYKAHEQFQKQLSDGSRKFSSEELAQQLATYAELIELMLYVGRVEEAAQILDAVDAPETAALMTTDAVRAAYFNARRQALTVMFRGRPPMSRWDSNPADHYRVLRQWVALCVGNFEQAIDAQVKEAAASRRDLEAFRERNFRGVNVTAAGLPDPLDVFLDMALYRPLLNPLAQGPAVLGGLGRVAFVSKLTQLVGLAEARVNVDVRLALTYLEWGDVPRAVIHFKQALEGSDFSTPVPNQRLARTYLEAVERAAGRRPGTGP
jgi:tetratricopeptide (TPR) repeat protein